jgi:hypothetical protein
MAILSDRGCHPRVVCLDYRKGTGKKFITMAGIAKVHLAVASVYTKVQTSPAL